MAPDDVVGTWALVCYELHAANGPITRPFGPHPRGYLLDPPEGLTPVAVMPP